MSNTRTAWMFAALSIFSGCNKRVFEEVKNSCDRTIASDVEVPLEKAADILIVVDNSGSMQEEQDNLARNFFNDNPSQCPLTDLANIPDEFKNPARALYVEGGPLARCGFIQMLAAFDNDFRVGVITSDVGLCDNRLELAGAGWGFRPQRGCLQPDASGTRVVISRADLQSGDAEVRDIATRFTDVLSNIRTFGSPIERGMDAIQYFLDGDAADGCAGTVSDFRRDNAQLVVIALSDEEDCSHDNELIPIGRPPQPLNRDDLEDEICGIFTATEPPLFSFKFEGCYSGVDELPDVEAYADRIRASDRNAKVAVIAGAIDGVATSCSVGDEGLPVGGCYPSLGNSNRTLDEQREICSNDPSNADVAAARQCNNGTCAIACCQADAGGRWIEFANEFGDNALTDSICKASFQSTMLDVAAFIAAVDVIDLAEAPVSANAIVVQVERAGGGDAIAVRHLDDASSCETETGFYLEGTKRIVLCGDARPGPGDEVRVRAPGKGGGTGCEAE